MEGRAARAAGATGREELIAGTGAAAVLIAAIPHTSRRRG